MPPDQILLMAMPVLLIILFVWMQRNRTNKQKKLLDSLRTGDKVVTTGGLIGKIENIKKDIIVLKIDDKAKVEVLKDSIAQFYDEAVK